MRTAQMYEEEQLTGAGNDAEFSLGLGSLIGIFFGLALVCGVFFGFGYTMGHRTPAAVVSEPHSDSAPAAALLAPKPSAQVPQQPAEAARAVLPSEPSAERPATATALLAGVAPEKPAPAASAANSKTQPEIQTVAAPAAATVKPLLEPSGAIMVQIAAVKSQPDAEALAAALRKNGFNPSIRSESQDKLLHVQIGPFASRDEAKAMRQKLSNAGYNAFIK